MVDILVNNSCKKKKVKRLSSSNLHYYPSAYITKPCDQLFGPQLPSIVCADPVDQPQLQPQPQPPQQHNASKEKQQQQQYQSQMLNDVIGSHSNKENSCKLTRGATASPTKSCIPGLNKPASLHLHHHNYQLHNQPQQQPQQQQQQAQQKQHEDVNACTLTPTSSDDQFSYIPAPKWTKLQNATLEELFKKSRYPKPTELKSLAQRLCVMDTDIEVCLCLKSK